VFAGDAWAGYIEKAAVGSGHKIQIASLLRLVTVCTPVVSYNINDGGYTKIEKCAMAINRYYRTIS